MDREFVQDFEATKARFEAWWSVDLHDRPPIVLKSLRDAPRWPLRLVADFEHSDPERALFDVQHRIDVAENHLARFDFWADAIPTFARGVNTGYLGVFAGAEMRFEPDTVWIEPTIRDWGAAPEPQFDTSLPYFQKAVAVSEALWDNAQGRYLLQHPDHLDACTTVMQMRGLDDTMIDLIEQPCAYQDYCDKLIEVWKTSYDWWLDHDAAHGHPGAIGWHQLYSSGRDGLIQCDFTSLISPEMFRRFAAPEMAAEAAHLGRAVYHMDGVGQLPHLDQLLDIPHLTAIQWQPGDGKPRCSHWPELLQRIQAAGKGLQLFCGADDLEPLTQFLNPRGVMLFFVEDLPPEGCRWVMQTVEDWVRRTRVVS